ncbi:MAG: DUF1929 domain-containing protein [Euryarchaeota archaeon]|nr:DUF1929 domain-containing protein [Euryarchaeota archaeon]
MDIVRTPWRFFVSLALVAVMAPALPFPAGVEATHPIDSRSLWGEWGEPFDGEVPAVNLVVLHDGRVLYWSGVEADETDTDPAHATFFTKTPKSGESRILDLSGTTPVVTTPTPSDGGAADLFCSGQIVLPDGRVVVAGSTEWHTLPDMTTPLEGGVDVRVFDPATDTWTVVDDMEWGRWYPSVIQLPDGSPLAISGITNLTMPHTQVLPWERYDHVHDHWSEVDGADRLLPLYPRVFVVPGGPMKGEVFYNTVGTLWGPFGEHPAEATWSLQQSFDPDTKTWRFLGPSVFGARQHGASVMLPLSSDDGYAPRFLTFGGTLQRGVAAVPFAEVNDLSTDPPTNTAVATMANGRWHLNGVTLPDGKVLAVGGAAYDNVVVHGQENVPILSAEIYDPEKDRWLETPEMEVARMYHSTAALLPDGSVLLGGHVPLPNPFTPLRQEIPGTGFAPNPQTVETRFEVYRPPYMFRGDRPTIDDAPDHTHYGATFTVNVTTDAPVDSVVLVRPGATTHAFDMAQRSVVLNVVHQAGGTLTVEAPPDATVAQPGHWMLFVNEEHPLGPVPSEARFVHVS